MSDKPSLKLELDRESAGPGDSVTGQVRVEKGGSCRRLVAELVYAERTADYSGATVRVPAAPLHEGDLADGLEFPFSLRLPADALPNQSSPHGAVQWVVHAWVDRFGFDEGEVQPLSVALAHSSR